MQNGVLQKKKIEKKTDIFFPNKSFVYTVFGNIGVEHAQLSNLTDFYELFIHCFVKV